MPDVSVLEPDLDFKREILGLGAHDLTACYQCGTCSVVCPISTADNPFPRREMVWVQWGLRDRLMADSAVWLCHQCGTCTTYCPRDAKPADVMAALRDYSIRHFAVPGFMGRALSHPGSLPLLLAIPTAIFVAVLAWLGNLTALPPGPIVFSKFMPIVYIETIFIAAMTLCGLGAAAGGLSYWRAMSRQAGGLATGASPRSLLVTILNIFRHRRFRDCTAEPVGTRKTYKEHLHGTHLLAFYGFLGLVATTTSVGIGIYAFGYPTPWPLWHPVKILGYTAGAALLVACAIFGYRRIVDKASAGKSTYSDWLFIGSLFLTTLTGFISSWLRLAGTPAPAYWIYFIHLVLVFFLLVYIPYSKFAHLVYRATALWHAERLGRARGGSAAAANGRAAPRQFCA